MQRTFSSQMTTELLISCILIRYKRTRFYTLMGFVYFEQLYIYCPNSFLNYFSEPFEIIRQGGWIFKEAGRNENLKLIIYGLNFCCSWLKKKKIFSAFNCLLRMQFIVAEENFFLALSIIYKCQPPIPYIHVQGFWWLQFDFSSPIFCRLLIVHHLNHPLLLPHKTK